MMRTMKRKVRNLVSTIKVMQYEMKRLVEVRRAKIKLIYLCTVQFDKQMRKSLLQKLAPVVANDNKKDSKDNKKAKKTKINKEFANLQLSEEELHQVSLAVYEKMKNAYRSLYILAKQSGTDVFIYIVVIYYIFQKPHKKSIPPSSYFEEALTDKYKDMINKIKMSNSGPAVSPTPSDRKQKIGNKINIILSIYFYLFVVLCDV